MLNLLTSTLFSISANIDNIPIGISYGIKKIHVTFLQNIFISIFTAIATFTSMQIGKNVLNFFDIKLANLVGSILLIILGTIPLAKLFFKRKKRSYEDNAFYSSKALISIKEIIFIIITLSINNIATGIAASITGINALYTAICTLIFGSIFLYVGNHLGKKINNKLVQAYSEIFSSLLLILLGLIEVFVWFSPRVSFVKFYASLR